MDELFSNEVPPWGALEFHPISDREGEEWKHEQQLGLAEALYGQSREIYQLAKLFCETLRGDLTESSTHMIIGNLLVIPPKIVANAKSDLYVLRMENAGLEKMKIACVCILPFNCRTKQFMLCRGVLFK